MQVKIFNFDVIHTLYTLYCGYAFSEHHLLFWSSRLFSREQKVWHWTWPSRRCWEACSSQPVSERMRELGWVCLHITCVCVCVRLYFLLCRRLCEDRVCRSREEAECAATASQHPNVLSDLWGKKKQQRRLLHTHKHNWVLKNLWQKHKKNRKNIYKSEKRTLGRSLFVINLESNIFTSPYLASGSYSDQILLNSSRWCGPRIDQSRVR